MKRLTLGVLYIGLALFIAGFILTCVYEYRILLSWVLSIISQADKLERILTFVSPSKFKIIQIALVVFSLAIGLLIVYFEKIWIEIVSSFLYLRSYFKFLLGEFKTTPVKWILILPFISSVYFAVTMPVSYDEAYTYLQFSSRSPIASLFYYPLPNNHVLHSLITNFTYYIPFCSDLFSLRISNVIFSVFTWLICFSFLKKYYSINFSLVVTAITSMLFMSIYYSYMSRGYGLIVLFFIISLYAAYNIIHEQNVKRNWIIFSLSSILGFFTILSYLYAWIILNAIILIQAKHQLKKQFLYNSIILSCAILLYVPIILINGIGALVGNRFVLPINREEVLSRLPEYISGAIYEITGIHTIIILVLLIVSGFLIFKNRNRFDGILTIPFVALPALLLLAHSVIPFSRTFNYYAFVLVFLIFLPYKKWLSDFSIHYLIVGCVLIQGLLFIHFYSKIHAYESFNVANHELNKKIVGKTRYYFNAEFFEMDFLFENQIRGFYVEKGVYSIPEKVDKDTLSGFDYYIIDKKNDCTKISKPAYSNATINVYADH